jgi:23S rRNA pseudouridine1911/1915/1917 synthase
LKRRSGGPQRSHPPAPPAAEFRPEGTPPDAVVLSFNVPPELAGLRLDRFLQQQMPRLTRTRAQHIVRACAFRPDGVRRRPSDIVRAHEVVYLVRDRFKEPATPQTFGTVYEDDALLVVDKPAGLPMHPTATYHKHTLSYLLRQRYADSEFVPRIAHRLDRETSGLVLCGKTLEAERKLKRAFERHLIRKTYVAIVRGRLASDTGEIAFPLAPVREGLHVLMEVREPDGLTAVTQYRVLSRTLEHSLLALAPSTGRQHQLRVHLSAIGHAIVGDKLYGPEREAPFLEYIETGLTPELELRLGLARQALHAFTLEFAHPASGAACDLRAELPEDMCELWQRCGGELAADLVAQSRTDVTVIAETPPR